MSTPNFTPSSLSVQEQIELKLYANKIPNRETLQETNPFLQNVEEEKEVMEATVDTEVLSRLAELRRENADLKRAKQLRESYGINFYIPHAKQDKFHSVGHKTGRYCRTGNRGGKTKCGAAEDVSWCIGGRTFYRSSFDVVDGQRNVVRSHVGTQGCELVTKGIPDYPVKGLLVVADWDKAKEIFTGREGSFENWGELFQLIPRDAISKVHLSRGGHVDQIVIKRLTEFGGGESTLQLDTVESYKHSKMSQESSDWDFIHIDEPCPRPMFVANARGLADRRGKFWFNCTPIDELWIDSEFTPQTMYSVKNAPDGLEFLTKDGSSRFMITWSIHDNPWMTAEGIADFESLLTREERVCRLHGLPLAFAGLIYKEFIHDLHVLCDIPTGWKDYHLPPDSYTIRMWWDFHTRLPQAVLFFATDPKGRVFVYDELFDDNLVDPVAKSIIEKTKGRFVPEMEIDPFALIRHPVTDSSIQDTLLEDYGLWFDPATKDLSTGINMVRKRLLERDPEGMPTIYFSPRLQQTLFEFSHYVYDIKKNEPKDADNHQMENLYRAVLNGLSYIEPPNNDKRTPRPFTIHSGVDRQMAQPRNLLK